MTQPNYSLDVISHHKDFSGKTLKKYQVEGIETVGAYGNEPFEVKFTNHTWQKIQVKLSIDGTDILSGATATTEVDSKMWVVNGHGTLSLKCWPEDNQGGAAFVFTNANNSVAVHTHGDLSARGIIAAAVFVEGHVEPIRVNIPTPIVIHEDHRHYPRYIPYTPYPIWEYYQPYTTIYSNNTQSFNSSMLRGMSSSTQNCSFNSNGQVYCNADSNASEASLDSLVAVGAGEYTNQKINYVQGLIKPLFSETVRIRYMWYDELVVKLKENSILSPHPSGFPGDKPQGINLGKTPRIGSTQRTSGSDVSYSRI